MQVSGAVCCLMGIRRALNAGACGKSKGLRLLLLMAQEEDMKGTSMKADELLEILKEDKDTKRDEAQSGVISDKAR